MCSIEKYIDGPGKILAFAGPRYVRPSWMEGRGLTITGEMVFEEGYSPSFGTVVSERMVIIVCDLRCTLF